MHLEIDEGLGVGRAETRMRVVCLHRRWEDRMVGLVMRVLWPLWATLSFIVTV